MEQCTAARCKLAGAGSGAAERPRWAVARLWGTVVAWALVAPALFAAGLCLIVLGALLLGIWLLAWAMVHFGSRLVGTHWRSARPGPASEDDVAALLDSVEAGRLSAAQAIRCLGRRQAARRRGLITLARAEVRTEGASFCLRLPYMPAEALLTGLEMVVYPAGFVVAGLFALIWRKPALRAVLADLPVLPVSRLLFVVLRSGACVEVGAGQGRVHFSVG